MKQTDYRLAAIMYTDIVGFSKMMGENEAETLQVLSAHNQILDAAVAASHGKVIKTIGDAYMVDFRNTVEALQCAIEIQERLYEYNSQTKSYKLLIRIGLHLGDIYFYEKDAFGEGINIAARLQSFAKPGCICFSQDVFNQVLNKVDFHAEKLGRVSLKNIDKEIHAYEIETKNAEFDTEKTTRNRKILVDPVHVDEKNAEHISAAQEKYDSPTKSAFSTDTNSAFSKDESITNRNDAEEKENKENARKSDFDSSNTSGNTTCNTSGNTANDPLNDLGHAFETIATAAGKKLSDFFEKLDGLQKKSKKNKARCDENCEEVSFPDAIEEKMLDENVSEYYRKILKKIKKENTQWDFERVQKRARQRYMRKFSGFVAHLISFIFINALFWTINVLVFDYKDEIKGKIETKLHASQETLTESEKEDIEIAVLKIHELMSKGFFPWAGIITFAWGIGLISNVFELFTERKKMRELDSIFPLTEDEFPLYMKIAKHRSDFAQHFASTITIPFFLYYLNSLFSFSFPWHLIVIGVLVFGLVMNAIHYFPKRSVYVNKLCEQKNCDNWRSLFE